MVEPALTLSFYGIALIMVGAAYNLASSEKGQKIFFIGTAWLFSTFGISSVYVVAGAEGYGSVRPLAFAALVISFTGLIFWLIYMVAQFLKEAGVKIFGGMKW